MMRALLCLCAVLPLAHTVAAAPGAPRIVGVPPTYAVRDFCRTEDGEIRHYGWRVAEGRRRRVYVATRDGGESWVAREAHEDDFGAMQKSPYSGRWIGWRTTADPEVLECGRSSRGPGFAADSSVRLPKGRLELRQMIALRMRQRWVAAFSDLTCVRADWYQATVALSDDDGLSWRRVDIAPVKGVERQPAGDLMPRWFNDGCEPTVVELADGTLLLAVRTSGPHVAFCRSSDGGETWSEGRPDEAFWQANTMPYLFRLKDGRILFIWNNTQMLPMRAASEYPELDQGTLGGYSEVAFNNRDALHAAISSDNGRTWRGFRELVLNPLRWSPDFRERGNAPGVELDKSVHQTQALELEDGQVLLAYGQGLVRGILKFDPDWLLEDGRTEDFSCGLENVSTHLFVKSLSGHSRDGSGHCQWNRTSGAMLMRDPDTAPGFLHETLNLSRVPDPRLVSDLQGVVWNFPARRKGVFRTDCRVDGAGFRLALTDHWVNPGDWWNPQGSPVVFDVTTNLVAGGTWHQVACRWDLDAKRTMLFCDGQMIQEHEIVKLPRFGLSYVHLQTLADGADLKGSWFRNLYSENTSLP